MQEQHLSLHSHQVQRTREKNWHDLHWIIDQGSKKPSRVQLLLATGSMVTLTLGHGHCSTGTAGSISPEQSIVQAHPHRQKQRTPLQEVDCFTFPPRGEGSNE
uniref:Uncharacterized protein n=1 Tax=Arundo donax TaxID=35708 RepID=A0A0A8ZZG7_ARUDO